MFLASQFLPGGAGDVGGDDIGGMPVEAAAGAVVSHGCEMKSRRVSGHGGWRIKGGGDVVTG